MRQQPWHFFTISGWQSLGWCDAASAPYTRSRHCNAEVTVRFSAHGGHPHDVCRPSTTGKMPRAAPKSLFAFIDLTKAFDAVNRELLLWKVLSKFGCPPHFLQILREVLDGMSARVVMNRTRSTC